MKLSIVVLAFNKFNFTKSCIDDLLKLKDCEIILVDNASSDQTQDVYKNSKDLVYLRNEENYGFAKGCNIGYAFASSNNVLFLNNDIKVKSNFEDWVDNLLDNDSLVGPTMGLLDDNLNFVKEENKQLSGKSYMSGWCLAANKKIWEKLFVPRQDRVALHGVDIPQVFSEEFGKAYFEDTDLSFRARKLNIPFKVVDVPVTHFGKISSSQINTRQLYLSAREVFVKKWKNK